MIEKISIPAFVFKPIHSNNVTTESIRRQDHVLEIDFPVFEKEDVLNYAEQLALRRRKAHDRPLEELLEILDQLGKTWMDPNYEFRKEAMDIIPMMTGQSKQLVEIELNGSLQFLNKKTIETVYSNEIGGRQYLEGWVPRGNIRLHAQPRGVLYHNLAGNAFNVGLVSLYYGLISKSVNLIKLPHEEPYFSVRLAQSITEIDKKLASEMAILYWQGSRSDIYDDLFKSGNVDCLLCWGGLRSIEELRRRAYFYGIKVVDHGPKLSFSVISEDILHNAEEMNKAVAKIATDIVFWNQKACLSPRVIYLIEKQRKIATAKPIATDSLDKLTSLNQDNSDPISIEDQFVKRLFGKDPKIKAASNEFASLMQRSSKLLRNEMSDLSPLGFAKKLAEEMKNADQVLPRAHLTEVDGMQTVRKREYFKLHYEINKNCVIFTPPNEKLDWTVVYLRNPPLMNEIEMCSERFVIVTHIADIQDLIDLIRQQKLNKFLQTISLFGNNQFVESTAEDLSLLGGCRFPRTGEHNIENTGSPWDGHYILQNLMRWSYIVSDTGSAVSFMGSGDRKK